LWATLIADLVAGGFLLLAFVAILRALSVRPHQALFLDTVIDPQSDSIRAFDPDFVGRGLLFVAAHRHAMCDHMAAFVRAGQLFLVIGVVCATAGAMPALFAPESALRFRGEVSVDSLTARPLMNIDSSFKRVVMQLDRIQRSLDSVVTSQIKPRQRPAPGSTRK
jgi:hypothetical protein